MKRLNAGIFAAVAASLGSMLGFSGRTPAESVTPRPEPHNVPREGAPKGRFGSNKPPKSKRAKRRRSMHAAKAEAYRRFCLSGQRWAPSNTGEHRHGHQRRSTAFAAGLAYTAKSRRAGTHLFNEATYAYAFLDREGVTTHG